MSSNVFKVTPLCGARSDGDAYAYLLQVDDVRILLDCGWDDRFDRDTLEAVRKVARFVDYVLLSHPTLGHVGGLPYALHHLGLSPTRIYATHGTSFLTRTTLLDAYHARARDEDFDLFTLNDIKAVSDLTHELNYGQDFKLTGKGAGITVRPFNAGHTFGGSIWRISKEGQEVVYAVNYNHMTEE